MHDACADMDVRSAKRQLDKSVLLIYVYVRRTIIWKQMT